MTAAGTGAERILQLFWWMMVGAGVIWLLVLGIAMYALRWGQGKHSPAVANGLIVGGGAIFPTVVLAILLGYGLYLIPQLRAPAPADGLRIAVSGEQWWWRVRYRPPGGPDVTSANEIRLPVGQRVEFLLSSPDVIHSFWIPSLGGKLDMIPGRLTRLVLEPTRTGIFRGACAEYCGTSHALMAFPVVVMEPGDFDQWLADQSRPAQPPTSDQARRGQELFLANGCGACHTVRGTPADGVVGPDLTHVGSRLSLGAGTLPNQVEDFVQWIGHTEQIKPDVRMPSFHMLERQDLLAMAVYLEGLK